VRFAPEVDRAVATVRLGLFDAGGQPLHDTSVVVKVLPRQQIELRRLQVIGKPDGKAARLVRELGAEPVYDGQFTSDDSILIDDWPAFERVREDVATAVRNGARALFLELPDGTYKIANGEVVVGGTKTKSAHFVSRDTAHPLVEGFEPDDFKFWFNANLDRPSPLFNVGAFRAPAWERILVRASLSPLKAGWQG
jgi:hypothetical protein